MLRRSFPLAFAALALGAVFAAEPAAPPPPPAYDVAIRYRINAFGNDRIIQYNEMTRYLKGIGFARDPNEDVPENEAEDANASLLRGTVPSGKLTALLAQRHVRAVRALPKGQELPKDKAARVRVDLTLAEGLPMDRQRAFAQQVRQVLASFQYIDGVGYDTRCFTRLLGSMPAGQVDALLNDLRRTPAGMKQSAPFQNAWPVRLVTVYPQLPLPAGRPTPPVVPAGQEKLTADLREALANPALAGRPQRLEVILAAAPTLPEDRSWLTPLQLPGVTVEGRLGPLVSVAVPDLKTAPALAALPEVAAVRLPRVAQSSHQPEGQKKAVPLLDVSGVAKLHALGHRGRGTRLAVVDSDFRGWDALVKSGQLPDDTRLVDFTRERNPDLQPDPFASVAGALGSGTRCALTVLRAAPEVQLVLVRIDPAAPYMLQEVARAINGDPYRTVALEQRQEQLREERRLLDLRQEALLEERAAAFRDLGPDEGPTKRRAEYKKHQAEYDRDEKAHQERVRRYLQLVKDVAGLKGVRVVTSGLVWNEGYPVDGGSALSRYFDDRPFRAALWFQAAGDTRGQAWAGLFRDADGNGVMEFAPPERPLPAGAWTPELNFLSWQRAGAVPQDELPGGARLRISLQWREAHDGTYARIGEDRYHEPLADLRLVVLYQPDPAGKTRPADDLGVVAQSAGLPQRLDRGPRSATYEQTVELPVRRPGRYAVRVEGRVPASIEPAGVPTIPAARKFGELRARVFVQTLGGAGRAVFHDFPTGAGTLGMPADARGVITVGAADGAGKAEPFSAAGPPYGLALLRKPDVLEYDQGEGTGPAACFAAGLTAAAHSGGVAFSAWCEALRARPGGVLRVPPGLPRRR
jgi:hypothetical protein